LLKEGGKKEILSVKFVKVGAQWGKGAQN